MCLTFDANNRINNGVETYDAAGNMLTDGFHTYTYDAENRITCVDNGAAVYQYDAEGRRLRKITGASSCGATTGGLIVDYLYDLAGRPVTIWCAKCSWGSGWDEGDVWAAGMHLATYSEGTLFFNHSA